MKNFSIAVIAAVIASQAPARDKAGYTPADGDCAGLPRLTLRAASGFCVGLAAERLGFPRGVLPLADGRILVADMGPWDGRRGRLLELTRQGSGYAVKVLASGLNRPHGLQLGPDGQVWIGEAHRISRVDAGNGRAQLEPAIDELPQAGRHPLKNFVFARDGSLYLNRGSPSDNCETGGAIDASLPVERSCTESDGAGAEGAIWRYVKDAQGRWTGQVHARGLRNSMALAINPADGQLWQGENSRDGLPLPKAEAERLPHDELNRVRAGAHYGWPYCYDAGVANPEFAKAACDRFEAPARLLPAHAAPLGMVFYDHPAAPPAWRNSLVIAFHGYRAQGHRIVGYRFDAQGQPAAALEPLVDRWERREGQPLGAPTDIKADAQGRLWVTEDRNGTLLVIAPVSSGK